MTDDMRSEIQVFLLEPNIARAARLVIETNEWNEIQTINNYNGARCKRFLVLPFALSLIRLCEQMRRKQ